MYLVVLVEEASMGAVLKEILPKILPDGVRFHVVPYQGKGDLMNNIKIKLRGWKDAEARFIILRDQDRNDCRDVKAEIVAEVEKADKPALVRIVCRELESWYFGDLAAVSAAYGKDFTGYAKKRKFRDPDVIHDVKKEFLKLVPEHQQIMGAQRIAPHMSLNNNRSKSFNVFVDGVRRIVDGR